jgi:hypothetical protein
MSIRLRPKFAALTALTVVLCNVAAFADVTWNAVKAKVAASNNYEVKYNYDGPKGKFKFDYRINTPDHIRAELLESNDSTKPVGSVVVYDAKALPNKVRTKIGGGTIIRNLTHKDIKDTPFYQPVFKMIVDQVGSAPPVVKHEGDTTRFEFNTGGGSYSIWANKSDDIIKTERVDGHEREIREFNSIHYNTNPNTSL